MPDVNYCRPVEYTAQEYCEAHFAIADILKSEEYARFDDLIDVLRIALLATNLQLPVPVRSQEDAGGLKYDVCVGCCHVVTDEDIRCCFCGRPLDRDHSYFKWQQEWKRKRDENA